MKYKFLPMHSSEYDRDFIFNEKNFSLFGNPEIVHGPILFFVDNIRYVISEPREIKGNKNLCYKIGTYLYHNDHSYNGVPITYFFGDISKCENISSSFENQICKIVSYEMVEEWYPKSLSEINNKLVNFFLKKQKYYGQIFTLDQSFNYNYLFFVPNMLSNEESLQGIDFIKSQLFDNNLFIQQEAYENNIKFILSEYAIEKYQPRIDKNEKTAFIAIKFTDNEERIQSIQKAISKAGYTPVIMNELEHNNWIMPEIFHQLKICKFVVVDLSERSDGAYYEAGYALALGKEVIHTYDINQTENQLHFDVTQKATILYSNLEELEEKLFNRIKATVY